ncbi:MAG: hypothetical protein DRQ44_13610, partial [Gammaproteobacteria bacterium]
MNFFEAQDTARRTTSMLVVLFGLAVIILLLLSNFIVFEYFYFVEFGALTFSLSQLNLVFDGNLCVVISAAIVGFVCLGSIYKLVQLSAGGSVIAQHLGGIV